MGSMAEGLMWDTDLRATKYINIVEFIQNGGICCTTHGEI